MVKAQNRSGVDWMNDEEQILEATEVAPAVLGMTSRTQGKGKRG
jgi:hypothetical protein